MNEREPIEKNNYLILDLKKTPLSKHDFFDVKNLISQLEYEEVTAGDAGDMHKLKVGRFRRDIEYPKDITPLSTDLMKIIYSDMMIDFYRKITQLENVCIRRSQANIMEHGDYVGVHIDGEGDSKYKGTHKDYKFAVVLHFELNYTGGDTILYTDNEEVRIRLPEYSMLVITGSLPHKVDIVTSGTRVTLAYFLSDNFGLSKK